RDPLGPVRGRMPGACRGADRGGPAPPTIPRGLAVGPASAAPRADRLPEADRRAGGRRVARSAVRGGRLVVASVGPRRGRPRRRPDPVPRPAETRAGATTIAP